MNAISQLELNSYNFFFRRYLKSFWNIQFQMIMNPPFMRCIAKSLISEYDSFDTENETSFQPKGEWRN